MMNFTLSGPSANGEVHLAMDGTEAFQAGPQFEPRLLLLFCAWAPDTCGAVLTTLATPAFPARRLLGGRPGLKNKR